MKRLELRLDDELYEDLCRSKPRSLSLPAFCALLIEGGIDASGTLGGPSGAGTPSTSYSSSTSNTSSLITRYVVSEEKSAEVGAEEPVTAPVEAVDEASKGKRKRAKPADGGPEFELFWKQYLAISHRANGQTKPAAVEAWQKAVKDTTPDQLRAALTAAVNHQAKTMRETGWAAPFPDCHRWLAKGYWQQFLDAASPMKAIQLPDLTPPPEFADCPF